MGWVPCVERARDYSNLRLVLSLMLQRSLYHCPNARIYPSVLHLRKEDRPAGLPRGRTHPTEALVQKLQESPVLGTWALSPDWFRAPPAWPRSVLPGFKWRLIPSPVELGSIWMHNHFLWRSGTPLFEHCLLLAYCYGFKLPVISEFLGISEAMLERHMLHAVGHLSHNVAPFIVWATATDYQRSILPNEMFNSLGGKRNVMLTLQDNPFKVDKGALDSWAVSPRIMTHLIYHTEKKSRLDTRDRDMYLSEAPHGAT